MSFVLCARLFAQSNSPGATPPPGPRQPLVIELWPGKAPDETVDIGPERVRISPVLDRKPVEVKAKDKDELSPALSIVPGMPPVFLAHGDEDVISPPQHSVCVYPALKRAGIPAELHVYAQSAHDFAVRTNEHPCSAWTTACEQWLRHQGFLPLPTTQ